MKTLIKNLNDGTVVEVDISPQKHFPRVGEYLTLEGKNFTVNNLNTVISKNEPSYTIILVVPDQVNSEIGSLFTFYYVDITE